jgi:hypothetical protein
VYIVRRRRLRVRMLARLRFRSTGQDYGVSIVVTRLQNFNERALFSATLPATRRPRLSPCFLFPTLNTLQESQCFDSHLDPVLTTSPY